MLIKDKIKVGSFELRNRMVKAPIHSETCVDGKVTPETEQHYEERTKGGRFGLVVVEHSFVRKDGMASPTQLSSSRDSDIDGLKRICDIIHKNGSTAILQISHAGCGASRDFTGEQPVSSSNISVTCGWPNAKPNPEKPRPLTVNEIHDLEEAYFRAAERAMKAGYDGINLHSAHAYLLDQFFSPLINKRTDAYNGYTLEGRTRIHMELIKGIRQVIGDKSLFALRLGGCDYMERDPPYMKVYAHTNSVRILPVLLQLRHGLLHPAGRMYVTLIFYTDCPSSFTQSFNHFSINAGHRRISSERKWLI